MNSLHRLVRRHKALIFLLSLLFLLICFPFLKNYVKRLYLLPEISFSMVLVAGVYAVSDNLRHFKIGLMLALVGLAAIWLHRVFPNKVNLISTLLIEIAFFSYIAVVTLRIVLSPYRPSMEKIYDAISAYLLLGLVWALIYYLIFNINANAYTELVPRFKHIPSTGLNIADFFYYSFVTLTTLGYGDIIPTTEPTQMLAALEAIFGQFYLAVLVARLVGFHISQSLMQGQQPGRPPIYPKRKR